ncbi:8-amino-7-oxononanoate synthase [Sodalis glossinidius str. 'morsitans']|uniref:8-amino-7-oxononanoate synthase n=2 Tax=Sodalis glossinidius (strain morsitans) TaxID=343509 RepID=BIOF_SODGM|nr:8-amino-7-oxononanoate synthase [Sodalis glossinidius]Q2NUJ6.1 RecName: Full=8-amino-7-oxononanoate synthase; Short=AONS; AltName: Full=7-keto-8-amino-pelargonic acid synthase; Short=7-KAP synthase; Short=KAPA synthase; AltName: Full=8-amino-7-ketopelargonate synthase [Sodalis glossinidius str. 'morsitans']BAE74179.1 8-amino-7-oxononanoate synthase [Sodalis glossinidius str. 'morsitans']CRL44740.1 8-amino-7-oxononanoate synthase [Sodalis glossinidius str. 'morsitans']
MADGWMARIDDALAQRRREQTYRERWALSGGNDRLIRDGDRQYLNFSSNDYLGLARHPEVIAAWQQGAAQAGVGAGGSGHVTGYGLHHQRLEQRLADWLGFPRALLFTSGFAANQALVGALTASGDHILADRLSHASLLEAAMHSPATLRRFAHNDADALQRLLRRDCAGNRLVITEGVFSMDGDRAPLPALAEITRAAGCWLMVDDAHGIGVVGEEGRGCAWAPAGRPDLLVVTFGKAVGVSGAAVLCATPVAEYLLQFARHLIYSTAPPPAQIAAIDAALTVVRRGDALRQRLWDNIVRFRRGAAALGFALAPSDTAIQPLVIGDNLRTLQLAQRLRERGVWLTAIRPPTVPPGSARLRITLTSAHLADDIDTLLEALSDAQLQNA